MMMNVALLRKGMIVKLQMVTVIVIKTAMIIETVVLTSFVLNVILACLNVDQVIISKLNYVIQIPQHVKSMASKDVATQAKPTVELISIIVAVVAQEKLAHVIVLLVCMAMSPFAV